VVKETLDGIETIQTSNAETLSIGRISEQAERLESDELKTNKYSAMITGSVWALTSVGPALTWWQGGLKVFMGEMTIGTLVVFTGFVTFIYSPFRRFTDVINVYQKGIEAVERIQEILDADSSIKQSPNAKPLKIQSGRVEFRNVSFAYAGQCVLNSINLNIESKELTGIVGKSGSGKSSLLKLITRLYDRFCQIRVIRSCG
jgi:ABC-type multidrug transport system, ATPase and permease components